MDHPADNKYLKAPEAHRPTGSLKFSPEDFLRRAQMDSAHAIGVAPTLAPPTLQQAQVKWRDWLMDFIRIRQYRFMALLLALQQDRYA
jgi:hypothetical protein